MGLKQPGKMRADYGINRLGFHGLGDGLPIACVLHSCGGEGCLVIGISKVQSQWSLQLKRYTVRHGILKSDRP
ncbi:hypothetical protein A1353_15980 [Methylomonas methanica]|uniref:Uncharacterized protein n=1 Tax=Methylomonas methanica TaxID=421 RepID=A0A177MAA1_METMH|nr:hypothetical protein A1353_15980 [Methylomonas methanica]